MAKSTDPTPLRSIVIRCTAFLALGLFASVEAQPAECTITSNTSSISFGSITVPRDASVGTPIGPTRTSSGTINCPSHPVGSSGIGFYLQFFPYLQTSTTVAGVWQTSTAGIGIRAIVVSYGNQVMSTVGVPRWGDFAPPTGGSGYTATYTMSYQLVKTAAQVTSGPINIAKLFDLRSHDVTWNITSAAKASIGVGNSTIAASTCTVLTPQVNVTLPEVSTRALSPVGTAVGSTGFQIGLSCQSGSNVYVTLTDATSPSNRTNLLTSASGTTAKGVQLQILRSDGTPIAYGPDSALPGNANQWLVGGSDSTNRIPISLTARYVSTGTVGPGDIKGIATFTMSYQ